LCRPLQRTLNRREVQYIWSGEGLGCSAPLLDSCCLLTPAAAAASEPAVRDGQLASVLHPSIKAAIREGLAAGQLTWLYLLTDNVMLWLLDRATPVHIGERVIQELTLSGMQLRPALHLRRRVDTFYRHREWCGRGGAWGVARCG
jgi:hypothetical protein